jgi:hypothetical protein
MANRENVSGKSAPKKPRFLRKLRRASDNKILNKRQFEFVRTAASTVSRLDGKNPPAHHVPRVEK